MIQAQMFGRLSLRDGEWSLGPKDFGGVKPKQVLEVLLLGRGQPVSKDRIADLVWGDSLPRSISATLETYVSVLRRSLAKLSPSAAAVIVTEAGGYRLDPDRYSLDLDRFDSLIARARSAAPDDAALLIDAALDLVAGEVLADEPYALYAQEPREVYKERHTEALLYGARLANSRGDFQRGAVLARGATQVSPLAEPGWRKLMLAQYALGQRAAALRTFERCAQVLSEELGVEPARETRALHAAILREERAAALVTPLPAAAGGPGARAVQGPAETSRPNAPLYGRSAELQQATDVVQEALGGRFTVLLLQGAPGMGKTRFLEMLAEHVRSGRRGTRIGTARGHCLKQLLPGVMAGDAIRSALAGVEGIEVVLDAALSRSGGIGWLALDRLATLMAGAGPVVLVFDDLHEADTTTLSVLAYLRQRIPEAPVAVVAAAPLRQLRADHPLRMLTIDARLHLDVLRAEDVCDVSPALWAKTGGHPQLLSACLKATAGRDEWPAMLSDLVLAHAREAGVRGHASLVSAALFERPFSAEELAALTEQEPLELIDDLEQAVEREILTMSGTRFAFRYEAVREILLQSMTQARRELLSRRLRTVQRPVAADVRRRHLASVGAA